MTDKHQSITQEREQWKQVETLLDRLETLPSEMHEDFLQRACPDPAIRAEVLAILAADESAGNYLHQFSEDLRKSAPDTPDLSGRRMGAYRLLKPLGRGGMGLVYEAERADGAFEQRVALKLLTTALTGTEAHRHFLAERRILAGLQHPAIARILDAGVTDDGTPWFAMEHVQGLPIDEYCDQRRLGIRERLELFLQVCDAVEYAHRRLIVHRDLKPANVLVTTGPATDKTHTGPANTTEKPTVKLLDFGIAKLLKNDGEEAPTRTSLRLMTPEYASPEQIRGQDVTTASDVYQLGLLLYELLTGHRPYAFRRRHSVGELERVICELPPTRLSAAITRDGTAGHSPTVGQQTRDHICHARRISPARLRRQLRGDLENIVGKALSKEPERRYGSADRLAQDIRRFLTGQPVMARADTWLYRSGKFLRRHALGASAVAIVLLLTAGFAGYHIKRVEMERDRVEIEAIKARQVSNFLISLFRDAHPHQAQNAQLTARELLDRGVERVSHELVVQPEVKADMLHVLGQTYIGMGALDTASDILADALELRRQVLVPDHPDIASVLSDIGWIHHLNFNDEEADAALSEAIANLEGVSGAAAERLASALLTHAELHARQGQADLAVEKMQRALETQLRLSGPQSPEAARIMHRVGVLNWTLGNQDQARMHYVQAIEIYESAYGENHPALANLLTDLANLQKRLPEQVDEAESTYRRSLQIQEKAYGPEYAGLAITLTNLGGHLMERGQYAEAQEAINDAYEITVKTLGPSHPEIALPLVNLGELHLRTEDVHAAQQAFQEAAEIRGQAFKADQFDALLFHALASTARAASRLEDEDAVRHYIDQALAVWRRAPETTDPRMASALSFIGRWLIDQNQCDEARTVLEHLIRILDITTTDTTLQLELGALITDCGQAPLPASASGLNP